MYHLIQPFQLLERSFGQPAANLRNENWFSKNNVPVNIYQQDHKIIVKAEAPGFDKKDFEIVLDQNQLTISGKRETQFDEQKDKVFQAERKSFDFKRVVDLPQTVKTEDVKAVYQAGILTLELLVAEPSQVQKIEIN